MIKIGDFAKMCNVSARTLRYYDDVGVLKADYIEETSGYRFYSPEAVKKYEKIVFYKELGFSLEEIKKLQVATEEEEKEILKRKKGTLLSSVQQIQGRVKTINGMFGVNDGGKNLSHILNLPFTDDPEVVGKWELCGMLSDETDLNSIVSSSSYMGFLKEIIFMPGGAPIWLYCWTKGILYTRCGGQTSHVPNHYQTFRKDGEHYMIIHVVLNNDTTTNQTVPFLYRQVDKIAYSEEQARAHIDKVDYPFVEHPQVSGMWNVVDFVRRAEDFHPARKETPPSELSITNLQFLPRGICIMYARTRSNSEIVNWGLSYTKGLVIDRRVMTAAKYIIQSFDGKDYLLVQHKSGDYYYGGMEPYWYVFERKDDMK